MLLHLLADADGSFATGAIIGAVSGGVVAILGAWGILRTKLMGAQASSTAVLTEAQIRERESTAEIDRKARKDERDELRKMLTAAREDHDGQRQEIHDLRDELGAAKTRLAVCEFERGQMREELDDLRAAVEGAGIVVRHRPRPPMPGTERETTVE
jgi:hypothetical protein